MPHTPCDAGELIGQRDRGHVVTASSLDSQRPGPQSVRMLCELGGTQNGSCTVDEQHAEVAVAPLGDPAEASRQPRRVLSGREAEVCSEVTPGTEAPHISHVGHERGRGEHADPGYAHQERRVGHVLGEPLELPLDVLGPAPEFLDLGDRIEQDRLEVGGHGTVVDCLTSSWREVVSTHRDRDAELPQ